jgi:uncharacterized membrane protein
MDVLYVIDLVFLLMILIIATLNHILPRLTRREIFFSVTVSGGYRETPEARKTIRRYRAAVWVHALIAASLVVASHLQNLDWIRIAAIFWLAGGCFLAFLKARHETLPHAESPVAQREAAVAPRPPSIFGSWWLQAIPFAVLAAAAAYLQLHWDEIPVRFPIHWELDGRPNEWSTRTFSGVYGPLLIGVIVCLGLALTSYGIQHWTRQVQARGAGAAHESFFRASQRGILFITELFLAVTSAWTGLLPLYHQPNARMPGFVPLLVGSVLFTLFVIGWLIYTGQGGENLSRRGPEPSAVPERLPAGDRTPDRCWKAGVIYINRNDPAVLVEKRFGVGYTLNFGHPVSWILLGSLVLIPAALAFFLGHPH